MTPFRRVFVACEGFRSEIDYLNEVLRQSEALGLRGRVEVIVLNRYPTDSGLSHPAPVISMTADHMEYLSSGRCAVDLFLSRLLDSVGGEGRAAVNELRSDAGFAERCEGRFVSDLDDVREYAYGFMAERGFIADVTFEDQVYDRSTDEVCIIIDRDEGDERVAESYGNFVGSCKSNGFELFVTNPKFEFWVLMHLDGIGDDLASVASARNPAARTDKVMKSRGLDKGRMDYASIVANLRTAMRNAEPYESSVEEMESKVGTNMPTFFRILEK